MKEIVDTLGPEIGVLAAVVIAALGLAVVALWRRLNTVQDARINDQKEHTRQIVDTNRVIDSAVRALEGRNG